MNWNQLYIEKVLAFAFGGWNSGRFGEYILIWFVGVV